MKLSKLQLVGLAPILAGMSIGCGLRPETFDDLSDRDQKEFTEALKASPTHLTQAQRDNNRHVRNLAEQADADLADFFYSRKVHDLA